MYPTGQVHWKVMSDVASQVPPFWHGRLLHGFAMILSERVKKKKIF